MRPMPRAGVFWPRRTFFQTMLAHSEISRSGAETMWSRSFRACSLPGSSMTHLITTLASMT